MYNFRFSLGSKKQPDYQVIQAHLASGLDGQSALSVVEEASRSEQGKVVKYRNKNAILNLVPVGHLGHLVVHPVELDINPEGGALERWWK